ncbi:hypothetical protein Ah1_00143 [Aeromonas phage Ah1]|uniref:Uncharacterized protein n=1 Tax=Aeromonas phage Ah1 TaxID=2053701 RepID=A0A2H4YFC7_9CAUD|nr:hypothetical protein KNT77_gp143 [Aeromonas phage Ah1]AUE22684.1 hypothetical protein Ah1_00143 [Aeromonas phage Ah1]
MSKKASGTEAKRKEQEEQKEKDRLLSLSYKRPLGIPMISFDGADNVRVVVNTEYMYDGAVTRSVDLISGEEFIDFTTQIRYSEEFAELIARNQIEDVYALIHRGNAKIMKVNPNRETLIRLKFKLAVKNFNEKGLPSKK